LKNSSEFGRPDLAQQVQEVEDIKELVVSTLTTALAVASSHPQSLSKIYLE
jgi:hypothetical protein